MGSVAQPSQHLREEGGAGGQASRSEGGDVAPLYSQPVGVEAGQQGGPGGRTPRLGVETLQTDSFSPQGVQVRGGHGGVMPGDVIVTNVVTNQQQEVWRPLLLSSSETCYALLSTHYTWLTLKLLT